MLGSAYRCAIVITFLSWLFTFKMKRFLCGLAVTLTGYLKSFSVVSGNGALKNDALLVRRRRLYPVLHCTALLSASHEKLILCLAL